MREHALQASICFPNWTGQAAKFLGPALAKRVCRTLAEEIARRSAGPVSSSPPLARRRMECRFPRNRSQKIEIEARNARRCPLRSLPDPYHESGGKPQLKAVSEL